MNQDDHGVLPAGTRVADYLVVDVIGRGGFGITYHVRDEAQGAEFALKEFYPEDLVLREGTEVRFNGRRNSESDYRWSLKKFHEEAKLLAQFNHPNIVRLQRIFEANNSAYMLLDYIRGRTFERWLQSIEGTPTQEELDIVAASLLDALELVHDNRAFHLDISPDNIMIRAADGMPILLDFGASRVEIKRHSHLVSALVVKRGYSAPEQYSSGASHYGAWTDIYALAATLYRAIAGEPPLESTQRVSTDVQITALQCGHGRYRDDFLEAIDWALTLPAKDRPQSIREWRVSLLGAKAARRRVKVAIAHTPTVRLQALSNQSAQDLTDDDAAASVVADNDEVPTTPRKTRWQAWVGSVAAILVIGGSLLWSNGVWKTPPELLQQPPSVGTPTPTPPPPPSPPPSPPPMPHFAGQLLGHTSIVNTVALSPDGRQIVSGSTDKSLQLWDTLTGKQIGPPFTGHTAEVTSASFSPDGRRIVSASFDKTVRIWDVLPRQRVGRPLIGHTGPVNAVAFSPDGLYVASASHDKTIRIWDALNGQPIGPPLVGHSDWVYSVSFSSDGRLLVSGGGDKTVRLWDVSTGQTIGQPLAGHTGSVVSVIFSPDGRRIASASHDKTILFWDVVSRQPIGLPLTGHRNWVNSVAFSPDGRRILSASHDGTLQLWDALTGQQLGLPLRGESNPRYDVATRAVFSLDGRFAISGGCNRVDNIGLCTLGLIYVQLLP